MSVHRLPQVGRSATSAGCTPSTGAAHHHGLGRAARELGVTKDQLKAAIEAARRQQASQPKPTTREVFKARKDAFIAAVAQQLNKPADQVADALAGGKRGGLRPRRR